MVSKLPRGENTKSYRNVVLRRYISFQLPKELSGDPVVADLDKMNPQLSPPDASAWCPEAAVSGGDRIPEIWAVPVRLTSWLY
jgi:hypothetical protein